MCDCEMRWYRKWYFTVNDTDHMKDITCRSEDGEDVLMKEVDLEDMYCEDLVEDSSDPDNSTIGAASFVRSRLPSLIVYYINCRY